MKIIVVHIKNFSAKIYPNSENSNFLLGSVVSNVFLNCVCKRVEKVTKGTYGKEN